LERGAEFYGVEEYGEEVKRKIRDKSEE